MMDTHDDIFAVARELPPAERRSYLDAACDSPEQRARVEALLGDAEEADGFFAVLEPPVAPEIAEKAGDVIGRYKLLQKIGEGGFGVVFMAEQREPIVRRVALKIIKAGMDTRQVIARFEAERQALAMMEHPGIAKVFDAGSTSAGRPYFVMELVRGLAITMFCDQQKYDTQKRIALFMSVCAAVQHAHQKGIIHRDLKPSNIIVGLDGDAAVVKVIDFGIAKATQQQLTDMTLFTRFEQFVGTPLYISPEQASLSAIDIDTRSDIYSMGVLLYELLTGKPPIDASELMAAGFDEMRRIIREKEVPKPSTRFGTIGDEERRTIAQARHTEPKLLSFVIRGELDWIVLKALAKDRSRRYGTATALREDLERFLRNEPVKAAAPSRTYQMRKFLVRHRAAAAMVALLLTAMVAGTVVSAMQAVRAKRAEAAVKASLADVERARRDAEDVTRFLADVFRSADPRDGSSVTLAETLGRATGRLDTEFVDQPDRRAHIQLALGAGYYGLGLYGEAAKLQQDAYWYFEKEYGEADARTLAAMDDLGLTYSSDNKPGYAHMYQERVLRIRRETNGPNSLATLSAMHRLATSYDGTWDREDAKRLRIEVFGKYKDILGPDAPETLGAMQNLAISYEATGNPQMALNLREEVWSKLREQGKAESPEGIRAMGNLAISYGLAGRNGEALSLLESALAGSRKVFGAEHPNSQRWMNQLADAHAAAGRSGEALPLRQEAARARGNSLKIGSGPKELRDLAGAATSYENAGLPEEGAKLREEIARRAEVEIPVNADFQYVHLLTARVEARARAGRWKDAAADEERLISFGPESGLYLRLAALLLRSGDHAAYQQMCERCIADFGKSPNLQDTERMSKICWLMPDLAIDKEQARSWSTLAMQLDGYSKTWAKLNMGMAEYRCGNHAAAEAMLGECLSSSVVGGDCGASAHAFLAMTLHRLQRDGEARESLATAGRLLGETFGQADGMPQKVATGQWDDWLIARCVYQEAVRLLDDAK
ncbi:tetratricopeptide repeat protein [Luteolibacter sp. Populi]|uniref:protein kinase domain-containing protein n=1 Tax=Luteolibacter sp. Populi TaxID=3230487 RepID=UPI0034675EE7